MRHREQEDLRRQPDGFKPNYMENVSTDGAHTSTCLVTFYTDEEGTQPPKINSICQ